MGLNFPSSEDQKVDDQCNHQAFEKIELNNKKG